MQAPTIWKATNHLGEIQEKITLMTVEGPRIVENTNDK